MVNHFKIIEGKHEEKEKCRLCILKKLRKLSEKYVVYKNVYIGSKTFYSTHIRKIIWDNFFFFL